MNNKQKTASAKQRLGFMKGQYVVPEDFDTMFQEEIEAMFYGSELEPRTEQTDDLAETPLPSSESPSA